MGKTILIGLDGATFSVLNPLMDKEVMPFLKEFVSMGVRGNLRSTINPLTPPAWISMVTGRSPGNHGIFDFLRPEERDSGLVVKFNDSRDIKCETIWSIASRQKRRVASLNFYGMNPPIPVSGYMISGFVPWKHLKRATHPPEFFNVLKSLPDIELKEIGFHLEQEKKCFQGEMAKEDSANWIRSHLRREQYWFNILCHIMENDSCDLIAIVFDGVDKLQHLFWNFLNPDLATNVQTPWDREIQDLCLQYFRQLDGFLSEIVFRAGKDARVLMASDHGFDTTTEIFYLNKWLHDHGYLEWADPNRLHRSDQLTADRLSSHMDLLNWEKTSAYAWTPSSNGVFIRVSKKPGQPGVPLSQYEAFREKIRQELLDFKDTETGERVIKHVLTREEAFPGQYMHLAPDLTLILRDSGLVSILNSDSPLKARPRPAGCHSADGIFIAGGLGIKHGVNLQPLSIIDVAPLMLFSLGLAIPEDVEGRLPTEIFEKEFLESNLVTTGEKTIQSGEHSLQDTISDAPDAEKEIISQLRMLGYME